MFFIGAIPFKTNTFYSFYFVAKYREFHLYLNRADFEKATKLLVELTKASYIPER